MDDNRLDNLAYLIASLREKFPFEKDVDLAEITHSPEWCLEAMIRSCGWQLIETAPKYTMLILCKAGFKPCCGMFDDDLGWIDFDPENEGYRDSWICDGSIYEPTHWMPLPPPPAGSP